MDDFEEFLNNLTDEDGNGISVPTWRATITRSRLTLTNWAPFLITNGPLGNLFDGRRRAGVTIADLTVLDEDEISVRYWSEGGDREEANEVLLTWAEDVGYKRCWLPDRIIAELRHVPERFSRATVRCPTCRARWSDGTPEFWATVRKSRVFPKWCPMCGCEMPQWTVAEPDPATESEQTGAWPASDSSSAERQERT